MLRDQFNSVWAQGRVCRGECMMALLLHDGRQTWNRRNNTMNWYTTSLNSALTSWSAHPPQKRSSCLPLQVWSFVCWPFGFTWTDCFPVLHLQLCKKFFHWLTWFLMHNRIIIRVKNVCKYLCMNCWFYSSHSCSGREKLVFLFAL